MLYQTTEGRLRLGDTFMDYAAFGTGKRAMVLIPGLSLRGVKGAGLSLAWMYRLFARDYRVYVFDRKEKISEGCTIWDLADDVAQAMAQMGIAQADMVGVSQGGMIAQALAIRYPEQVGRLVLCVTSPRANDTIHRVVGGWIAAAEKGDWRTINRETILLYYSEAYVRKYRWLLPLLERLVKPADGQRFISLARCILTFDAGDELEKITCPTLVLGGAQDRIVTGEASLELAEHLGCPVHLYEGLGHAACEEAGDFNRRVLAFFTEN